MPVSQITRHDNGNIDLSFSLSWPEISHQLELQKAAGLKNIQLPGFRKGTAPKHLAETQLDSEKLLSQALEHLLPEKFTQAVQEHSLKPIMYPRIQILSGKSGQTWQFLATTCEAPSVHLRDYKSSLAGEIKASGLEKGLEFLRKAARVSIPDMLVTQEADHRLSHLADNLTRLGMTVDRYLASKKLDISSLKAQMADQARLDLELEFILNYIQQEEKLSDRSSTIKFLQNLV